MKFLIYGVGRLLPHLRNVVKELELQDVVFFEKSSLINELSALDIFLYGSVQNNHFLPVEIAGAASLPVVSTNIRGIEEFIFEGKNGCVVGVNETKPMAEFVLRLADDANLRKKMGSDLNKLVVDKFSVATMANEYSKTFFGQAVNFFKTQKPVALEKPA